MTMRRFATVAAIALAVLLGVSTAALAGLRLVHSQQILPGVSVEGVDLGGLSADDAVQRLRPLADEREADPVTLTWQEQEFVLAPADIGYHVDLDATVEQALQAGRDGGIVRSSLNHVTSFWTEREVDLVTTLDGQQLQAWVDDLASAVDRDPFPGAVAADPDSLTVTVTPPADGATVRRDATVDLVLSAFQTGGPVTAELPHDVLPARIEAEEVEAVATRARRALEAPITLTAVGESVTLQPRDLAPMIALQETSKGDDDWTVALAVPRDVVEEIFADIAGRFEVAPEPASFESPDSPPARLDAKTDVTWRPRPAEVTVVPSKDGRTFDAALAASQLTELLQEGSREAELRLAVVEPAFSTQDARDLGIDTLLSTFTTYHAAGQTRVTNIQRLADMVDNTVVLPGEQFSVNQISGERTCSKGFAPAGMILNGEIVDVCGGGVSQFGTTTVNAVFFAGLKPDTYQPHSFYISRYPMGREATLNYPSPDIDVRFTNDTGYGILVRTSYTSTSITVSFYGHNDVDEVRAVHGQPYNTKPYPTVRRVNRSLPPGASVRVQSGQNGFSIEVTRIVVRNGDEERDDWSNRYVPETEIIEYNPEPAPPPPPPSPSPSPSPGSGSGSGDEGSGGDG